MPIGSHLTTELELSVWNRNEANRRATSLKTSDKITRILRSDSTTLKSLASVFFAVCAAKIHVRQVRLC